MAPTRRGAPYPLESQIARSTPLRFCPICGALSRLFPLLLLLLSALMAPLVDGLPARSLGGLNRLPPPPREASPPPPSQPGKVIGEWKEGRRKLEPWRHRD